MGQTITEKILGKAARRPVFPGEIIWVEPDMVTCPEISVVQHFSQLKRLGFTRIWDPERFFLVVDHRVLVDQESNAHLNQQVRRLVKELGIRHFYDIGRHGIGHQLPIELGYIVPGTLVIGGDTHVPTLGALGAFAAAINAELPLVLATGQIWLKVPESIKVELTGKLAAGLTSRDVAQYTISLVGPEEADYRVLEFAGEGLGALGIDERMTLCNTATEIGVKTAIVNPDEVTKQYLKDRTSRRYDLIQSDEDAVYVRKYTVDLSALDPQVAVPPSPDLSVSVDKVKGQPIDWAFIGSCASGRIEDLRAAAAILESRKIHPRVKMIMVPSSQQIYLECVKEGLIETFITAGAVVAPPSCGPCYGGMLQLADGEVCIGTGTRNEPGRMGSQKAQVFLASAATVAASAVAGQIADPREFLR